MHTKSTSGLPSSRRTTRPAATAVGVGLLLLLAGLTSTAQAEPAAPQLSIAVDNGRTAAREGDTLSYAVTITNLGTRKVEGLRVNQTVPEGADFVSADADGDHRRGQVSWTVDLAATQKVTLHITLSVLSTPDTLLRLASVACAQTSAKGPALVCASDSDLLPAGAAVEQAQAEATSPSSWLDGATPWYLGGAAGLLLAVVITGLVVRRPRPGASLPG